MSNAFNIAQHFEKWAPRKQDWKIRQWKKVCYLPSSSLPGSLAMFQCSMKTTCNKYHIRVLCPFFDFLAGIFWGSQKEARSSWLVARKIASPRFTVDIKNKLLEANKCLFVIRSLKKEGYCQDDIDHLFNVIVLPKLTYGLSVYAASKPELTTVQKFLCCCYKRKYISYFIDILKLLDKSDRTIFNKARNAGHPLHSLLPRVKESSLRLRSTSSLLPRTVRRSPDRPTQAF